MTAPLCRCRVLYIGSAVPTVTKDGLQGIQQPLKERYPTNEATDTKGIDSWLSVWSNGLLLEYIDGSKKTENSFFPIVTLHYCAAVRYVNVSGFSIEGGGERFIPLDTPFAQIPDSPHPPIFAAIFRRTTGVKVLECHAFICTNERAANALVRCCFHSYADTIYLKMDEKMPGLKAIKESSQVSRSVTPSSELNFSEQENGTTDETRDDAVNWNERAIGQKTWQRRQQNGEYDAASLASSLYKKSPKKGGKHRESRSELFENDGAILPYGESYSRRTGSHYELRGVNSGEYYEPAGSNYSMYERSTPNMFQPPPPHMMRPPPAPHPFFGAPPPMPPMGGPMPYPPHMMPPRPPYGQMPPYFMPPPFGPFMPPPHMMDGRGKPHSDGSTTGGGPIITDTTYDTFPRRATYEEPIYMPSNSGTLPPHSSYKPGSMSPEHYETYYETYRHPRGRQQERKNASGSDSDASGDGSNTNQNFWEAYEAGVYRRKPHINEKAFANTVTNGESKDADLTPNATLRPTPKKAGETLNGSVARPDTPPADYDLENNNSAKHNGTKNTPAANQQSQRANAVY
ncbi:hypothetical protein Ddc_07627 [Ditylenchus destructor]|nr:hypothetical protein Ddc_07627 [Ditylenchus destructor]